MAFTAIDAVNKELRRQLNRKQEERASNVADILGAKDLPTQRAAQAAVRRNDRSIALLVSKLLCDHELHFSQFNIRGSMVGTVKCRHCKASCSRNKK